MADYSKPKAATESVATKSLTAVEQERQIRINENESFKSLFEDAQKWQPVCYQHEKYASYCHACQRRKWFALLAKEVLPILDERLKELKSQDWVTDLELKDD